MDKITKKDLKSNADQRIVSRLQETIEYVTKFLEKKNLNLAQEELRKFTWDDLADWYIETNKTEKNTKLLGYILQRLLCLWHPFVPFVTEEIYQILKISNKLLMMSAWPKANKKFINPKAKKEFNDFKTLVIKIRNLRASYHIDPSRVIEAAMMRGRAEARRFASLERLARLKISGKKIQKKMLKVSSGSYALNLDIAELVDVPKELARLEEERKNLEQAIERNQATLKNKSFVKNAPKEIVAGTKEKLGDYKNKFKTNKELTEHLKSLTI